MVTISNKDWTDFVSEVRSRLDVIENNIDNVQKTNDIQHKAMASDIAELKDGLSGKDISSVVNRLRSLEDSRTKMNGVQLGISAAFSIVTACVSWLLGHPNAHLSWNDAMMKLDHLATVVTNFFNRNS